MDKKQFIENDLKKRILPRNVDIYRDMGKKRLFQIDLKFPEMWIFTEIWAKYDFFKIISKY